MLIYYTMVTEGGKNMEWVKGLQKAIDYIEDHITEDIDYAEIAKQAYSSSFHFQRVFHIICGYLLASISAIGDCHLQERIYRLEMKR